jgi:hypothetical protein
MASRRFNVILTEAQYRRLNDEAERTSLSVGELIRRAVDASLGLDEERRRDGLEVSIGIWRRPDAAVVGRRPGIRFSR